MNVVVLENSPVLINNDKHKNFVETSIFIKKGTKLDGDFYNVVGKRKGKDFTYRLFRAKDGFLLYANTVQEMKNKFEGDINTRVIDLPNNQENNVMTSAISVFVGIISFAVAKKMGYENKNALMIGGVSAIAGYFISNSLYKPKSIQIKTI